MNHFGAGWAGMLVVAACAGMLLWLGGWAKERASASAWRNQVLAMQLVYQGGALLIAGAALLGVWVVGAMSGHSVSPLKYLAVGDLSAPAMGVSVVANPGESWAQVGVQFGLVAVAITSAVVWLQTTPRPTIGKLAPALPWAVALSLINAAVEEAIFRVAVGHALDSVASPSAIALISGGLFGVPHWFGRPGRLPGVLMAGFLGWLMATAMLQTGGIVWPWAIHFLQDVPIFAIGLASAEALPAGHTLQSKRAVPPASKTSKRAVPPASKTSKRAAPPASKTSSVSGAT